MASNAWYPSCCFSSTCICHQSLMYDQCFQSLIHHLYRELLCSPCHSLTGRGPDACHGPTAQKYKLVIQCWHKRTDARDSLQLADGIQDLDAAAKFTSNVFAIMFRAPALPTGKNRRNSLAWLWYGFFLTKMKLFSYKASKWQIFLTISVNFLTSMFSYYMLITISNKQITFLTHVLPFEKDS